MDTSVWWSGDLFSAMRATLGADRAREHFEAHAKGETVTNCHLRAEQVVEWATRGGARALGLDGVVGSLEPGKKADVVLIKNDESPVMFPLVNPYGHVAFQAQRGDVHTVLVDGRVVKHERRLVGIDLAAARREVEGTVEYLRSELGEEAWVAGMHPEVPRRAPRQPVPVHRLPEQQHARLARSLTGGETSSRPYVLPQCTGQHIRSQPKGPGPLTLRPPSATEGTAQPSVPRPGKQPW